MKNNKKEPIKTIEIILVSTCMVVLIGLLLFIIIEYLFLYKEANEKTWNIYFSRIVNSKCSEYTECNTPTIYTGSTSTGDYKVTFTGANQEAIYEITVDNRGTMDAKLTSIVLSSPICKGNSNDYNNAYTDQLEVCNNLTYELIDEDGNTIPIGDVIEAKETKKYYLRLAYLDEDYYIGLDERLTDTVTVSGLNISLNYSQVGK